MAAEDSAVKTRTMPTLGLAVSLPNPSALLLVTGWCAQVSGNSTAGATGQLYDVEVMLPGQSWITKADLPILGAVGPNKVLIVPMPSRR
jgi:hypothetical protein